jgi:hypothetical protein
VSGVYDLGPLRDTVLNQALNLTDVEINAFSPLRLPAVHKPLVISFGTAELPTLVHDAWQLHDLRNRERAPSQWFRSPAPITSRSCANCNGRAGRSFAWQWIYLNKQAGD